MRAIVGTSGFSYTHWRGGFYPADLPQREWLEFYARHFSGVEVNSSFYHLPTEGLVKGWFERTPADFTFVLKGSRYVTHRCRLVDCAHAVQVFYQRASLLGKKIGAVLWQLPPGLQADAELLRNFLHLLPSEPRPVVEFRDSTWYSDPIFSVLEKQSATLCLHDMRSGRPPDRLTSEVAYMRFHGFGTRYGGRYPDELLQERAAWVCSSGATKIFAFFNNDIGGHAVEDARRFRAFLSS
ncbi:MAG: DUF72 domain-containing protein [Kiritimatiellia bacterium]